MKKTSKPVLVVILAALAAALIWTASHVTAESGTPYIIASVVLMTAYCVGQYLYGAACRKDK